MRPPSRQFRRAAWLILLLACFAAAAVLASRAGAARFTWAKKPESKGAARQGSYRTLAAVRNANAMPIAAPVCITAVGTANSRGPVDIHGVPHDYIEIQNVSDKPFDLAGCSLTDRASKADKWKFPAVVLPPGGWLIAWASGQDRVDAQHRIPPSKASRGHGWRAVHEDYRHTEYRVWQCTSPAERDTSIPGEANLQYPILSKATGPHSLWLYMQSVTSFASRVVCTVQGKRIPIEVARTNMYNFCPILNPDRRDGAWILGTATNTVAIDLLAGAVRVGRLVAVSSGEPFGNGRQDLHLNFRIARNGDFVGLFSREGIPLDYVTTPVMAPGESYRRAADRRSEFSVLPAFAAIPHVAAPPRVSAPEGPCESGTAVQMQSPDPRDSIRYTLNGSLPDDSSPLYRTPIFLTSNTVVRARSFRPGAAPSAPVDRTYWFDKVGPLPVLSVAMEQDDLDDPEYGLFVTRHRRGVATERPCHLTLIEPDGKTASARAGIRIQGRSTRWIQGKKNWRFSLREQYGSTFWPERMFADAGPERTASFVAIANGHAPLQAVYDAATAAGLRVPRTRLVAMYVNTRPYGLYLLADDINSPHYLEQAFGHLDLSVYKTKTENPVKWGPTNAFDEAWSRLQSTPHAKITTNMVAGFMDLTMLTRFYVLVGYFGIGDCAQGYFVRDNRSPDLRWEMILWDQEGAFYQPYEKYISNIPGIVGTMFLALWGDRSYRRTFYYPEYQAFLNHVADQERLAAHVSKHREVFARYASEEWAAAGHQFDERASTMTRESFVSTVDSELTNAIRYLSLRTDDLFTMLRKKMDQEAIHPVVVRTTPDAPPLLIDGHRHTSSYHGRYISGTSIRIAASDKAGTMPLLFDINGDVCTNAVLVRKVTEPLTITVSRPH